jgi:hypothetical protein
MSSKRCEKKADYEYFRNNGVHWTSFQCADMTVITITGLAVLVISILTFAWILRIYHKLDTLLSPAVLAAFESDFDGDGDRRRRSTADPPLIIPATSTLIDVDEEQRYRRAPPSTPVLSDACKLHWDINSCASAMWWMCNTGEVCSPVPLCKSYSVKLSNEMKRLDQSYIYTQYNGLDADEKSALFASATMCNKNPHDPVCGYAIVKICAQPSIHLICKSLTEILRTQYEANLIDSV